MSGLPGSYSSNWLTRHIAEVLQNGPEGPLRGSLALLAAGTGLPTLFLVEPFGALRTEVVDANPLRNIVGPWVLAGVEANVAPDRKIARSSGLMNESLDSYSPL
jgi:hypothetical protein